MRIRDWSSDVCSSDLPGYRPGRVRRPAQGRLQHRLGPVRYGRKNLLNEAVGVKPAGGDILIRMNCFVEDERGQQDRRNDHQRDDDEQRQERRQAIPTAKTGRQASLRSEENTSELQSLM